MKKIFIVITMILVICCGCTKIDIAKKPDSPDVISSFSYNRDQDLTVIAYREEIDDKEAFAKELIQMCVDNSFKTIKFSTDRGYATSIHMTVYLNEEDFENGNVAMIVTYKSSSLNGEYDIVNNPNEFTLTVE